MPGPTMHVELSQVFAPDLLLLWCCALVAVVSIHVWSRRLRAGAKSAAAASALMLVVLLGGSVLVVAKGRDATSALRRSLEGIAPTYASEMRALEHWRLASDAAPDDPLYLELIEAEKRWLAANPAVADIYTFRKDSAGRWCLIVDSETDYDRDGSYDGDREQRTAIGEVYEHSIEKLDAALSGTSVFDDVPVSDRWGTWVSAFVPLYDGRGGIEGVLGVDFPAKQWESAIDRARLGITAYVAVILTIIAAAALLQIGYLRHINESRRTGELLRRQAEAMDSQNSLLEQRAAELASAKSAAEAASKAKSDFLANMSHEIRTPMTAILGYADLLDDAGITEEDRRQFVQIIRRNGDHLLELINDILDLSKIEAGKFSIERSTFRLASVVSEVESTMRVRASAKDLCLKVEFGETAELVVHSDAFRLRQILMNLVGNAIKFTERGSVVITVRRLGSCAVIDVRDTGMGMTPEQVGRLFRPFTQADASTTRKHGGTGLGLAISRRLAEMLGCTLSVRSEPGEGSTFTLELPVAEAPATELIPEVSAPAPGRSGPEGAGVPLSGRLLLAEDGSDNQRLLKIILSRAGLSVEIVPNGLAACEAVLDGQRIGKPFDLILMDMQMPELDGYEATRRLRSSGVTTPIIALTAHAMESDRAKCLDVGCDDYLTKPIDRTRLISTCSTWLAQRPLAV